MDKKFSQIRILKILVFLFFVFPTLIVGCNRYSIEENTNVLSTVPEIISPSSTPIQTITPTSTPTNTTTPTLTPTSTNTTTPTSIQTSTPYAGHSELFYSDRITENPGEIFSLNLANGKKTLIFEPTKYGLSNIRRIYEISGSPLGTYLVFSLSYNNGAEEVILFNRRNGIINKIYTSNTSDYVDPKFIWSEDESKLIFTVYGKRINTSETSWTYEISTMVFSPIIDIFAESASKEEEQFYILINSSYKKEICTPIWTDCLRTVFKVPTVGLTTKRFVISPDKNRFLLVYFYENNEDSDIQENPEIQIGLFDLLSKNNTLVTKGVTDYVKPIFSTDGRHIFYDYYPDSIFGESYLFRYNIKTGEKVEILQNIDAFGVQAKGFEYIEQTTPTPKISPGPICDGTIFYDKKGDANMAYTDILEGSCANSNKTLNVSLKMSNLLKYVNLSLVGGLNYQILLQPPIGVGGKEYLIEISPKEGFYKGTMIEVFGCKFGEYQDSTFKFISDCNMEIETEKNTITIIIENFDILNDSRVGFFTKSGVGKDSLSWDDMVLP